MYYVCEGSEGRFFSKTRTSLMLYRRVWDSLILRSYGSAESHALTNVSTRVSKYFPWVRYLRKKASTLLTIATLCIRAGNVLHFAFNLNFNSHEMIIFTTENLHGYLLHMRMRKLDTSMLNFVFLNLGKFSIKYAKFCKHSFRIN